MAPRFLIILLMLLSLVGCGSMPGLPLPSATEDASAQADGDSAPAPDAIALENPYLDSERRVSQAARQRFAAATTAMAVEDWDTARADLEWLIAEHPKLSGPYLNLALLHAAQGQFKEAEHYFQATLEVNGRNRAIGQPQGKMHSHFRADGNLHSWKLFTLVYCLE